MPKSRKRILSVYSNLNHFEHLTSFLFTNYNTGTKRETNRDIAAGPISGQIWTGKKSNVIGSFYQGGVKKTKILHSLIV